MGNFLFVLPKSTLRINPQDRLSVCLQHMRAARRSQYRDMQTPILLILGSWDWPVDIIMALAVEGKHYPEQQAVVSGSIPLIILSALMFFISFPACPSRLARFQSSRIWCHIKHHLWCPSLAFAEKFFQPQPKLDFMQIPQGYELWAWQNLAQHVCP